MQIVHPFAGSLQEYSEELADPSRHRPLSCPRCGTRKPLAAHGFCRRTLVDENFDGILRLRRYICRACCRTVSLLPDFVLPYARFSIGVIARFLTARLVKGRTLKESAQAAGQAAMPYQRGQHWVRRFRAQAAHLTAALAALTRPLAAGDFTSRALAMLEKIGWRPAHYFLLSQLRMSLLGRPRSLIPDPR